MWITMDRLTAFVAVYLAFGAAAILMSGTECIGREPPQGCGAPDPTSITPLGPAYDSYFPVRSEFGITTGEISREDRGGGNPTFLGYYAIGYPKLAVGDIVPVYPAIYRVEAVGRGASLRRIRSGPLEDDQLPPGTNLLVDCCANPDLECPFAVPTGGGASFATNRFHHRRPEAAVIKVGEIVPEKNELLAAKLEFWSTSDQMRHTETVRVGDVIQEAGWTLEVAKIVPPDSETQVVGWVELSLQRAPQPGKPPTAVTLAPAKKDFLPVRSEYADTGEMWPRPGSNEGIGYYAIAYPKLSGLDIVPVFPAIYSVWLKGDGLNGGIPKDYLLLGRPHDDQIPPEARLAVDCCAAPETGCSYAVPLEGAGSFATENFYTRPQATTVRLNEIVSEENDTPAAEVELWSTGDEKRRSMTVRVGDIIQKDG